MKQQTKQFSNLPTNQQGTNKMNKTYALEHRHSALQGVTAYLMPGGRHQFTRSANWARTFTSFEEACIVAQKVGGVKVVEVEVSK
jgi:hypothetical protein